MTDLLKLLDQHWASITENDEYEMDLQWDLESNLIGTEPGHPDFAAFSYRTCQCGLSIEGFYQYLAHIKQVIKDATT
jgi:hypothetical protein